MGQGGDSSPTPDSPPPRPPPLALALALAPRPRVPAPAPSRARPPPRPRVVSPPRAHVGGLWRVRGLGCKFGEVVLPLDACARRVGVGAGRAALPCRLFAGRLSAALRVASPTPAQVPGTCSVRGRGCKFGDVVLTLDSHARPVGV